MVDVVSVEKRSQMMAGIKAKNTKPEITVRKILHSLGFRFRLQRKDLPGKPDLVLPKWSVAIFVHGCFWHGHENCPLFRLPKSRTEFWTAKIASNKERDVRVSQAIRDRGWKIVTVWECCLKGPNQLKDHDLASFLASAVMAAIASQDIRGSIRIEHEREYTSARREGRGHLSGEET